MLGTVTKRLVQGLKDLEIRGRRRPLKLQHCWDHPEYWEESRRLDESCCHSESCENHQLMLVCKTLKSEDDNSNVLLYWTLQCCLCTITLYLTYSYIWEEKNSEICSLANILWFNIILSIIIQETIHDELTTYFIAWTKLQESVKEWHDIQDIYFVIIFISIKCCFLVIKWGKS